MARCGTGTQIPCRSFGAQALKDLAARLDPQLLLEAVEIFLSLYIAYHCTSGETVYHIIAFPPLFSFIIKNWRFFVVP